MKRKKILTGILLILVLAGCVVIAEYLVPENGAQGISPPPVNGTLHATPTATPTKVPATVTATPSPTAAVNKSTPAPTPATPTPTPTPVVYTTTQVNQHFIDIAFGSDNPTISKIMASSAKIGITGMYTDADETVLSTFDQQFNAHSMSLLLPSAPAEGPKGDIVVDLFPGSSMTSLASDTSYSSVNTKPIINTDNNGTICSIYRQTIYYSSTTDMIYVNSDLATGERDHYLVRGVLYYLGFPGETGRYPTSIFYSQPNNVVNLSTIDWQAVQLMYGNKISNGMDLTTIQDMLTT